jgi:hypothetical protein
MMTISEREGVEELILAVLDAYPALLDMIRELLRLEAVERDYIALCEGLGRPV